MSLSAATSHARPPASGSPPPTDARGLAPKLSPWTVDGLVEGVERMLGSPRYKPPMLPRAALAVLELSRKPDVPFPEVVKAVELDPVFAASVLKVANSPLYATRVPATSMEQALSRMGLRAFANVCLEAAVNGRVFRSIGFAEPMERVRKHSTAVAHLARLVAQSSGRMGAIAFARGLLHDVGLAIGMLAAATPGLMLEATFDEAWPVIYGAQTRVGRLLMSTWKLDAELASAVESHDPARALADPEVAVLTLAGYLADDLGFSVPHIGHTSMQRVALDRLLATVDLDVDDLERIHELGKTLRATF